MSDFHFYMRASRLSARCHFSDQIRRRIAGRKLHQDDDAATRLDGIATDDILRSPVGTLDQNVRLETPDDLGGRLFVKDGDCVNALERHQDFGALALGCDWALWPFVPSNGPVRVESDDECVPKRACFLQIADMARVKQVEDAVGEYDLAAAHADVGCKLCGAIDRENGIRCHSEPRDPNAA